MGKVYIASKGLTQMITFWCYLMSLDSDKKIGKLKDIAIGRCRERIELAACKAKELMNKPASEGQQMIARGYDQSPRITSFLKKRHGL